MRVLAKWCRFLVLLPLVGCLHGTGVEPKRFFMDKAMKSESERREFFQATLLVLDEHPEYIDELFRQLLGHEKSLNRFLSINASGLDDPPYAALMARHLVRDPEPLTEIMVQTLEAAKDDPEARRAILKAMREQRERVADMLLSDPKTLEVVMGAVAKRGVKDSSVAQRLRSLLDGLESGRGGSGEPEPKEK